MKKDEFLYDLQELEIIENIGNAKSVMKSEDKEKYAKFAKYTKSLHTKKLVTIRFSVMDLAAIKAKEPWYRLPKSHPSPCASVCKWQDKAGAMKRRKPLIRQFFCVSSPQA